MTAKITLFDIFENIKDPLKWAQYDTLVEIIKSTPSVRGMVYGNVSEVEFSKWLTSKGIPVSDQKRDDDHMKTKSDRTILYQGRKYSFQIKSLQTNSIKEVATGKFVAKIQCDASDRRMIKLPTGNIVNTTCYARGEFDILAVSLQPFVGIWDFAFMLNKDLPSTNSSKYSPEDSEYLLKTLIDIDFPLSEGSNWYTNLFDLISKNPELGIPASNL